MRALTGTLVVLITVGWLVAAGDGAAFAANGSGCNPYVNGTVIPVPCSAESGTGGGSGSGGGGSAVTDACTMTPLDEPAATSLGLSWPPPAGERWALLDCVGGNVGAGPRVVLINAVTGVPQVTPHQLLQQALGELRIPYLGPHTAPPRGRDGLVGLAEWFWITSSDWHPRHVTVTAGPVWATVTAMPAVMTFDPGPGMGPVSCEGPGTGYDSAKPAAAQHTDCSYTYLQPSTGQPGNAYQASLTVGWRVTWTGSGGTGGVLDAALPVTVDFPVPVAQGEALVSNP